jgi:phage terminase small subunit
MSRPRKPVSQLSQGYLNRNPSRKQEAETGELGLPPEYLSEDQRDIWNELVSSIPTGTARSSDRFALEIICIYLWKFRSTIINGTELATLTSLLSKFGLTPSDRAKVAGPTTVDIKKNAFSEFV